MCGISIFIDYDKNRKKEFNYYREYGGKGSSRNYVDMVNVVIIIVFLMNINV